MEEMHKEPISLISVIVGAAIIIVITLMLTYAYFSFPRFPSRCINNDDCCERFHNKDSDMYGAVCESEGTEVYCDRATRKCATRLT
ncbi:hypothetical protein KY361_06255 [Candidatus Woesearchaeota archaeon]|nr:hypothetical protein [Candidatus Woesearchaeota archaeon]